MMPVNYFQIRQYLSRCGRKVLLESYAGNGRKIAFLCVGFNGYGGIWMEHTLKSEIIFCIVLYVPVLLLFFILALRMIIHHRRKAAIKYYFCDFLFCISAIVMSFLIFYFIKEPRQTIIDIIMYAISESGWLYYPVP